MCSEKNCQQKNLRQMVRFHLHRPVIHKRIALIGKYILCNDNWFVVKRLPLFIGHGEEEMAGPSKWHEIILLHTFSWCFVLTCICFPISRLWRPGRLRRLFQASSTLCCFFHRILGKFTYKQEGNYFFGHRWTCGCGL